MRQTLQIRWKQVPSKIRRPIVLTVGMLFVLLSGTIGWLPGPGGIPLLLLGIAILSTEYHWAHRLKVSLLDSAQTFGDWFRNHRLIGVIILTCGFGLSIFITYTLFYSK
jgi:hypothetical protein